MQKEEADKRYREEYCWSDEENKDNDDADGDQLPSIANQILDDSDMQENDEADEEMK